MKQIFARRQKTEETEMEAKLRKKLFVSVAMLTVATLLLITVSLGQYRIVIKGRIVPPIAGDFRASISLDRHLMDKNSTLTDAIYSTTVDFLTDLQPGDDARTYAASPTSITTDTVINGVNVNNRMFELEVKNNYSDEDMNGLAEDGKIDRSAYPEYVSTASDISERNATPCNVPLKYTVTFESDGKIPIEVVLVKTASGTNTDPNQVEYYYSKMDKDGVYHFYSSNDGGNTLSNKEKEFTFERVIGDENEDGTGTDVYVGDVKVPLHDINTHIFKFFVGWDNRYIVGNKAETNALADADARKQVEFFNIKVHVVNDPIGVVIFKDEQWYRDHITTNTDATPGNIVT